MRALRPALIGGSAVFVRHHRKRVGHRIASLHVDSTQLQILPLALIMVMGPQILTAIFLVTSHEPVKNSIAMLIGVVVAASVSLLIWWAIVKAAGIDPKDGGGPTTADWIVAGLLALAAIHTFRGRHTASVPKWMSGLQKAEPRRALTLGFLLILLMPTDIVAVISTANWLQDNHKELLDGWPLVAATTLLDGPADPGVPASRSSGPRRDARDQRLADHERMAGQPHRDRLLHLPAAQVDPARRCSGSGTRMSAIPKLLPNLRPACAQCNRGRR